MQKFILMIAVLFGLSASLSGQTTGISASPAATTSAATGAASVPSAPAQPIAFNHKLHIQTGKMSCNDCHESRGNGATVAMPQPPKCMLCHAAIATDKPDIQRLAAAAKNEESIAWVRVYRVPSFVTFSHKMHTSAGNTCEECHGPVAERTAIALEKDTSMGTCIGCHQAKQAAATCDTCHAIMSKNGGSPFDADSALLSRLQAQPAGRAATIILAGRSRAGSTSQLAAIASFLYAPLL